MHVRNPIAMEDRVMRGKAKLRNRGDEKEILLSKCTQLQHDPLHLHSMDVAASQQQRVSRSCLLLLHIAVQILRVER